MSQADVILAYRHLYRSLLRAVQYSKPARYTARDQLRRAFREKEAQYDEEGIKRTIWFLEAAAKETGLEHKILKNLLRTAWHRQDSANAVTWKLHLKRKREHGAPSLAAEIMKSEAYNHYDLTLAMLNKTMGLRLR